jgi:hypothetical protein
MGPPGPNGRAPRPKLLAGPSGSANRVVFPPLLRFSIVKARAEGMAQALTAQETAMANRATAAQRSCVDQIIAIPPAEAAYFGAVCLAAKAIFFARCEIFRKCGGVATGSLGIQSI